MDISPDQARAELARRELQRRQDARSQPQEVTTGFKGIANDVMNAPGNAGRSVLHNWPQWLREGLSGVIGAGNQILNNPQRAATNAVSAAPQMALDTLRLPFTANAAAENYAANKFQPTEEELSNLSPGQREMLKNAKNTLSSLVSKNTNFDLANIMRKKAGISTEPEAGDTTIQLATLGLPVAVKKIRDLGGLVKSVMSKPNPEAALAKAHATHDTLKSTAGELFDYAADTMKKEGVKVPLTGEIKGSLDKFIEDNYLPRTAAHKKLYEAAINGDPESLHELQSLLWQKGSKAIGAVDPAVSNKGEELMELRDDLNNHVRNKLIQEGHIDAAHAYKQGQNLYRELKQTYYKYPKIARAFDPELRKIPKDLTQYFGENSKPIKDFLKIHPELESEIAKAQTKAEAMKILSKYGTNAAKTGAIATGIAGGTYTLDKLHDLMKH